jgi:glycosyltransferase involved in cell wall biosynthesis
MALPYFKDSGWEPEVLCVDPRFVEIKTDHELVKTLPQGIPIHRCRAIPFQMTRLFGLGGIGWRSRAGLEHLGTTLLELGKINAVYFSSTVFPSFGLGPKWLRRFGIPYFIDYHDPMWTDYYFQPGAPPPPGGVLKYRLTRLLAKRNEQRVMQSAAGVTCVSPGYVNLLRGRYPQTHPEKYIELPFGAPEKDFDLAGKTKKDECKEVWRYIGAGGGIMAHAVGIFSKTLRETNPTVRNDLGKIKIELMGTSYATYGTPAPSLSPKLNTILPKVEVSESSERLPYMETLRQLRSADRLILFGTNDPGYTASKLGVYVLAKRPLLVICREESSVARIVRETRSAELITFGDADIGSRIEDRGGVKPEWREAMGRWLAMDPAKEPATDWKAFEPYTAKRMTEKLCRFFDERLEAEKEGKRSRDAGSGIEDRGFRGRDVELGIEDRGLRKEGAWNEKKAQQKTSILNPQSSPRPRVVLVHPGIQHALRLAEALEREGVLASFWTGWAKATELQGLGRRKVAIASKKLRTVPWLEWAALILSKTGIDAEKVWHWRNRIFQNLIPDKEIAEADVVIGFDTGSWLLAQKAKALGKKFILDQSIGHPAARIPELKKMGRAEEAWNEPYLPRPGRLADWEKVEHEMADRIVVGSRFTKNTLIGQGVTDSKIRILPYGVGEEFVAAGKRRAENRKDEKIRFLFLGQLAQRKGVQFLLEAWKGLPAGRRELVLMGGGSRYRWRQMAGEGVIFRGQAGRKEVLEEMGQSDVLVLPSLFEGFGLVILEAMAAGLPVITTTNTGGPDMIEDGKEGFIVPAGNVEALREKMSYFIQNPEQASKMGQSSHQKARQYTWERYGSLYAKIVEEVVQD